MKIAITYENDMVFQHFGHCEQFKIYELDDDNTILSEEVIATEGTGHEALAGWLADKGIDTVLCGGMGDGAKSALDSAGIEVVSGVSGNVEQALVAYVNGELVSAGVNCDHHHGEHDHHHGENEEGCNCGSDCGSDCGGGCGGSCGCGCGGGMPQVIYEGPNAGKQCAVHYTGTFDDGEKFDSSYDRNQPLSFIAGVGMMIPGFDKAVVNMEVGQVIDIHLEPEEAYGESNPDDILTVPIAEMPGSEDLEVGQQVYLQNPYGQPVPVRVTFKDDKDITFDANSEMCGKALNFKIELISAE